VQHLYIRVDEVDGTKFNWILKSVAMKNEQRATKNEQRATKNEQRATKDKRRATKDETCIPAALTYPTTGDVDNETIVSSNLCRT